MSENGTPRNSTEEVTPTPRGRRPRVEEMPDAYVKDFLFTSNILKLMLEGNDEGDRIMVSKTESFVVQATEAETKKHFRKAMDQCH